MNLSTMRDRVWGHLGTTSTDKAFTSARVTAALNDALNELCQEMPAGFLYQPATWAATAEGSHQYALGGLDPAVTSLRAVITARITSEEGPRLREVPFSLLSAYDGLTYAVTGSDEAPTLHTGPGVQAGETLYVTVDTWHTELASDSDEPAWLPARFHDVPCLMASEVLFASGDEGEMPNGLARKLLDRRSQLITHVGRRSADPMKLHTPETITA